MDREQGETGCFDYVDLGMTIRYYRTGLNWSQEDLAEKCGLSASFLGHIERGSRKPSMETVAKITNALGITPNHVMRKMIVSSLDAAMSEVERNITELAHSMMEAILTNGDRGEGDKDSSERNITRKPPNVSARTPAPTKRPQGHTPERQAFGPRGTGTT